jgi:hypothetical protein
MTTTDPWSNFTPPGGGDYPDRQFKFDTIGVSIAGKITNIRRSEFDKIVERDGQKVVTKQVVPELWLDTDDGETSVLCGQANLMTQLLDLRPNVGDRIAIVYTGQRKAKLGMAKLFDVSLKRSDGTVEASEENTGPQAAKSAADLL